ncbi:hypothetical protein Tco_0748420 [Tanacetum coccineum]|uniref:Uncharacterized protein n=1 Tax=Tanacetum coccineum TaxID=301880 RepID=A0ABQ4YVK9_9ASTR
MLKKFRLEDSKSTKSPMLTEIKLSKDDEADFIDSTKYRGHCFHRNTWSLSSILNHENRSTNDPYFNRLAHPTSIIFNFTKKRLNGDMCETLNPNLLYTDEVYPYLKTVEIAIRENIL